VGGGRDRIEGQFEACLSYSFPVQTVVVSDYCYQNGGMCNVEGVE